MDLKARLDVAKKKKILVPNRNRTPVAQPLIISNCNSSMENIFSVLLNAEPATAAFRNSSEQTTGKSVAHNADHSCRIVMCVIG